MCLSESLSIFCFLLIVIAVFKLDLICSAISLRPAPFGTYYSKILALVKRPLLDFFHTIIDLYMFEHLAEGEQIFSNDFHSAWDREIFQKDTANKCTLVDFLDTLTYMQLFKQRALFKCPFPYFSDISRDRNLFLKAVLQKSHLSYFTNLFRNRDLLQSCADKCPVTDPFQVFRQYDPF